MVYTPGWKSVGLHENPWNFYICFCTYRLHGYSMETPWESLHRKSIGILWNIPLMSFCGNFTWAKTYKKSMDFSWIL